MVRASANDVSKLFSQRLILFDVEFGNAQGFFSGIRLHPDLYVAGIDLSSKEFTAKTGSASIKVNDRFERDKHHAMRILSFDFFAPVRLFDMVSRYIITDTSAKRTAIINGRSVEHRSTNLYHQYPAGCVCVPVGEKGWIEFKGTQEGMPEDVFEHVFYVRDECRNHRGHQWIVHHRIVATLRAERLILRVCNPNFEGPVPAWFNSIIPMWILKRLFRIREISLPGFPVMVIGENTLPVLHRVVLTTMLRFYA